jgi:hypothetical protein
MATNKFRLSPAEWHLLWTLELGEFDLVGAEKVLVRLRKLGLASEEGNVWQATDYGRQLAASRRTI